MIAPVAPGADGATYNINADTFAGAVAGAVDSKRLLFLTDVPGVLDKDGKLIKALTIKQAHDLIADGTNFRRHDSKSGNLHRCAQQGR